MAIVNWNGLKEDSTLEDFAWECMFLSYLVTPEERDILSERFQKEVMSVMKPSEYPWYKFVLDNVNVTLKGE